MKTMFCSKLISSKLFSGKLFSGKLFSTTLFSGALLSAVLASCGSLQAPSINQTAQPTQAALTTNTGFRVSGGQILDPGGQPFTVRGVGVAYQTFIFNGQNHGGYDRANFKHLDQTLNDLQARGVNLARIFVTQPIVSKTASWNGNKSYLTMLDEVVSKVNARGMVALVVNSYRSFSSTDLSFVSTLATRYRNNPMVWLTPMNEPNCAGNTYNESKCENWSVWKREHNQYIQTIRNAGFTGPILINSISYSWDLSEVLNPMYRLTDPLNSLIYGAHRYGNDHEVWDEDQAADADDLWANLASTVPVVIDEVGADNGEGEFGTPFVNSLEWADGFMQYASNWMQNRGGDGVIGFTSYTSDGNTLYEDAGYVVGNVPQPVLPLQLTPWGKIFFARHPF